MNENPISGPNDAAVRTVLRRVGPMVLGLGVISGVCALLMIVLGFGGAVLSDAPPEIGKTPWGFKCFMLGILTFFITIPLLAVGSFMCQAGFLQSIQRYIAGESAPVAKDVINYLGEATQPGIKATAKAVTEGVIEAQEQRPKS